MRKLTREHIEDISTYALKRKAIRQDMIALKAQRRLFVGPYATFHFECFQTLQYQIQEMLFVEKGGEAQLQDELAAYAPLVPNGKELVTTLMFEIEEKHKRDAFLSDLGGIENKVYIKMGTEKIMSVPEQDVDRSEGEGGRTSSVHFLHFPFSLTQIQKFKSGQDDIILGFDHPQYAHMTMLSAENRQILISDFD